jgi:hypothetical protein
MYPMIGDKLIYDENKIYIGIKNGIPLVMTGRGQNTGEDFCFQSFSPYRKALTRWMNTKSTGQECIDSHIDAGFEIRAFDDTREAFQFFLDNLE